MNSINNELEHKTNHLLMTEYEKYFHQLYNTSTNKSLFSYNDNKKRFGVPDGWQFMNNNSNSLCLFIIENKRSITQQEEAMKDILFYSQLAYNNNNQIHEIICINGFGTDKLFTDIYIYNNLRNVLVPLPITLEQLSKLYFPLTDNDANNNGYCIAGSGTYQWVDYPVYNSKADSQRYGKSHAFPRRALVGAQYADSSGTYGSRCVNCNLASSYVSAGSSYLY